jgi:DNA-binding NtrC family response regulator
MMTRETPLYISEKPQLKGTSILVVEDQSLIAMDVEDTLREMGAQDIRLVSDAEAAMAALSTFNPHIAILDFNLGSVTSETVAEHLFERGIPFIFMTGYSDQSSIPERFRHIEVIRKPLDISSLSTKLNSMINAQI